MNFTCILGTVEVRDPCRRTVLPTVKVDGKYSFQFYLKAITQWKLFNPCHWFFFSPKGLWCVNLHPSNGCHCCPLWLLLLRMLSGGVCLSINLTNLEQGWHQSPTEFQYESHYKKVQDFESQNAPLCFWLTWIAVTNVFFYKSEDFLWKSQIVVQIELII